MNRTIPLIVANTFANVEPKDGQKLQMTLSLLPIEIQCLIFPHLDFTGLISLSQTNNQFRRLIDPQRNHFLGRLLELELLPQYGAASNPLHFLDATELQSGIDVHYACSGCFKLLSHTHFDNHSLLRLGLRKPPPGSRAASQLCGWATGDAKAQGLRRQAQIRNDTLERWISAYRTDPNSNPLKHGGAQLEELYHIGMQRHKRICNECKWQSGFWSRETNSNSGNSSTPVIKSRRRLFHDANERFFPGLFSYGTIEHYPGRRKIYREHDTRFEYLTMYSVRCPSCSTWQELAAFRKGGAFTFNWSPRDCPQWDVSSWTGPHFDEWKCNKCIAKTFGREHLSQLLLQYWNRVTLPEISLFEYRLKQGWHYVSLFIKGNKKLTWSHIFEIDQLEYGITHANSTMIEIANIRDLDLKTQGEYFAIWRRYVEGHLMVSLSWDNLTREPGVQHSHEGTDLWFHEWTMDYTLMVDRMMFLRQCTQELEAKPEILVDYALREDAYCLM